MALQDREILIGITGGVAAYKTAEVVSTLVQRGARVSTVMTANALNFIGKTTFEALTNRSVLIDMFDPQEHPLGEHIGLARRADVYLIAPATANCLAKLAHGIADDLVTALALSATCPLIAAPAMNVEMWQKPPVQRNVAQLRDDGWTLVGPEEGWLSCGVTGAGRMSSPADLIEAVESVLQ